MFYQFFPPDAGVNEPNPKALGHELTDWSAAEYVLVKEGDLTRPISVEGGAFFSFRTLWLALYWNRYVLGAALAMGCLAGLIATILTTPIYRATATVQIDAQTPSSKLRRI